MFKLIADLDTLRDMIGGDKPFHLEIREGIVQTFARLHLKALVNEDMLANLRTEINEDLSTMRDSLRKETFKLVAEHFPVKKIPNTSWSGPQYSIDKSHKKYEVFFNSLERRASLAGTAAITQVLDALSEKLHATIQHKVQYLEQKIAEEVKRQLTACFEQRVQREINRRVAALAAGTEE